MERYLSNQKTAKEHQAAKEKEVARIIRKAEEVGLCVLEHCRMLEVR